jgi:subtilisin family serine protease
VVKETDDRLGESIVMTGNHSRTTAGLSHLWTPARGTRHRPTGRRRSCPVIERLEPRTPMAADLAHATSVRRIDWEGTLVDARADGWIVQTSGSAAPQIRSGWQSQSLGEGFFSLTTPGASVADVRGWATAAGLRGLEPDRVITASALPNDPSFSRLYGLNNTGQTGGLADADIDAAEAWDVTTGSRSVVVSVIDTGVDYRHPDLAANVWTNPREVAGDRLDNDGNGYVDDVHGWDFANNDADPFDDQGHGTHVAGTIGAAGNNGTGVTGVNWQVSIMALKFLDASGSGTTSAAIAAINYATKMRRDFGVNIVATNNSWGGGGFSSSLQNAINAGGSAGILFVAAAGNDGLNNDSTPSYPASYTSSSIIAVAATDSSNRLASFSNYGATSVDVAAPGVGILSTTPNNTYSSYSGTSMATPQVTGVVALLKAAKPDATADQIRSAILSTTTPVSGLAGKVATGGVVNADVAPAAAAFADRSVRIQRRHRHGLGRDAHGRPGLGERRGGRRGVWIGRRRSLCRGRARGWHAHGRHRRPGARLRARLLPAGVQRRRPAAGRQRRRRVARQPRLLHGAGSRHLLRRRLRLRQRRLLGHDGGQRHRRHHCGRLYSGFHGGTAGPGGRHRRRVARPADDLGRRGDGGI